ncbi:MAG TPA: hypothetical protein PKN99_04265 [Cyclobacteriaceae bacterium]|nr:hypothetical protein [Cyclobacteriaceae bacterium]HNP06812.1 hypothetical protein [Cyclobacteriaceae bacterium]HRK54697.1 hypothetical protein [Cyclobacteriaceae bacterium]
MKVKSTVADIKLGVNLIAQNLKDELRIRAEEKLGSKQIDWSTIYITGKEGFKEEVAKRLYHSHIAYMPGYIGNSLGATDHDMYWIDKDLDDRSFKLAIGAKAIWKYRIRVYKSLEEFVSAQNKETSSFTPHDMKLIEEMRKGHTPKIQPLHSN